MEPRAPKTYAAIYAATFSRIAGGHYRPTHRIPIASLAENLGVSTTPVREALRQLAGRDLLVERHREGFYLAPLNPRAIESLYSAHSLCMEKALQIAISVGPRTARNRNLWRLFDSKACQTGDLAIIAVRRYLDDRLAVLRRHEAGTLGDMSERGSAFSKALAARDMATALEISQAFHARCTQAADCLAAAFEGQG